MELSVRVLCRPASAPGFELAGLEPVLASDAASAAAAVRRLAQDPRTGIVLVEDALHRALPLELRQRLDRQVLPMLAPFPSPAWDARSVAEENVLEILRQAIGYRVRPR